MILRADETAHARSSQRPAEPDLLIDLTEDTRPALEVVQVPDVACHVPVPLEVRAAQQWSAQWLVPLPAADSLLHQSGLRATQVLPGRGLLTITFTRALDTEVGRYQQVRVSLQVRRHDGGPSSRAGRVLETLGEAHGELVIDQPVNDGFVGAASQAVWGAPARRADIEIVPQGSRTACTVSGPEGHELTLTVVEGGPLGVPATTPPTYTWHDDQLRMTTWQMHEARGGRRPGGAALVLSRRGELPAMLRSLGLPKRSLLATTISHLSATYEAPCVVRPS